jgi:4-hydroxy-3-methylbut-2-enyl diphosphate reductase
MGSTEQKGAKPQLKLLLAAPRGFCAGVERAIRIVELALGKFGAPVYIRHEIVHNRAVVERLEGMGAIFIDELDQAPDGARVIFSAHGVAKSVPAEAKRRQLFYLNAAGRHVILIGHGGHPEVEGTMGQLPEGAITLVETLADVAALKPADPAHLAFITQTTLSVDDTHELVAALRRRFPEIAGPRKEDICYATTNRQQAIKQIAPRADLVLIIGAPNSSNSVRLVEVAERAGAKRAVLIENAGKIDWSLLEGAGTVALSAGASAPETLVRDVIDAIRARYDVTVEETTVTKEHVEFNLPRALAS